MKEEKSLFSEVRCDYIDESDGFWRVDAWKTDDDNEEGKVIALIDSLTARVVYVDNVARMDPLVDEVIAEKRKELEKERIRIRDEQGTLSVYFETDSGTLVGQVERKEDVGTDNFYVGLRPSSYPGDYLDLLGARVQPALAGIELFTFGNPSPEDPSHEEVIFDSDIKDAIAEFYHTDEEK